MRYFSSAWYVALFGTTAVMLALACTKNWQAIPDPRVVPDYLHCKEHSLSEYQMLFVPGYAGTTIVVRDCSRFRREKVAIAISAFEKAWYERFGMSMKVRSNLRDMLITFDSKTKTVTSAYDMSGKLVTNALLSGQTFTPNIIWVYAGEEIKRVCDSSLVHELVHASIWITGAERGDPDHLGHEYRGWHESHNILIQDVNRYLCALGI